MLSLENKLGGLYSIQLSIKKTNPLTKILNKKKTKKLEKQFIELQQEIKSHLEIITDNTKSAIKEIIKSNKYLVFSKYNRIRNKITTYLDMLLIKPEYQILPVFDQIKKTHDDLINQLKILDEYNCNYKKRMINEFKKSIKHLDISQKLQILSNTLLKLSISNADRGKIKDRLGRIRTFLDFPSNRIPKTIEMILKRRGTIDKLKKRLEYKYLTYMRKDTNFDGFVDHIIEEEKITSDEFNRIDIGNLIHFNHELRVNKETKQRIFYLLKDRPHTALDGTQVRSRVECRILDYLLGILVNEKSLEIYYENLCQSLRYKNNGKTGIIRPDFMISVNNCIIILEHVGIQTSVESSDEYLEIKDLSDKSSFEYKDAMMSVPQQFSVNTMQYMESMVMKVSRYNQENYSLIITTNDDIKNIEAKIEERLLRTLKLKFPEKEFLISHLDYDQLVEHTWEMYRNYMKPLEGYYQKIINIAKNRDAMDLIEEFANDWDLK